MAKKTAQGASVALAEWLNEQKIKRFDFAQKIGVSESALYGYLRGNSPKTLAVRQKIERITKNCVRINDWAIPLRNYDE